MLFSKPLAVSTASREVKRSRSSRSVLAVAFSMRPIRGQISQQIAAAWSTSGSVLWFDPMKLAWNNRQHYRLCLYLPSVNSPRCQTLFFPLFVSLSAGSTHGHFCSYSSQFTFCISCLNLKGFHPDLPPEAISWVRVAWIEVKRDNSSDVQINVRNCKVRFYMHKMISQEVSWVSRVLGGMQGRF